MRRRPFAVLAVPLLAAVVTACQALVGLTASTDDAPLDASAPETEAPVVDAGVDSPVGIPFECTQNIQPPSIVPTIDEVAPFAVALAAGGYTGQDGGGCPVPGFDLDGKRTCLDDAGRSSHNLATCAGGPNASCASSCENPIALGTGSASTLCDLANGVDNAFQQLTTVLRSSVNTVPVDRIVDLTSLFTSGRATLLFKVSGYSGEPDDDHVVVSVFNGTGLASGAHTWDGRTSVAWDVRSFGIRADGFVRQSVLVVPQIPRVYFPIFAADDLPAALVPITDVRVQARLERAPTGDAWFLSSGIFGGHIDARSLMRTAANAPSKVFAVEGGTEPSCIGTPDSLRQMRELVCQFADLAGTTPQCDALSVGFVFRTAPSTLGTVQVDAPAPPDLCLDAGGYNPDASCLQ